MYNRRDFIKLTGTVSAAALMARIKLNVALWPAPMYTRFSMREW